MKKKGKSPAPGTRPLSFFGSMRGTVLRYEGPYEPVPGHWLLDPLVDDKA